MLEPSGRVWYWARARPPVGQSSLTPFVERPSRATPPLGSFICWAQGRSALKSQKKGLPSCAGRTRRQARTLINNRQGARTAVFLLFHSHPCRLICDINPGRPRDICGPVSARRSQLSIRGRRCLHRPPLVPVPDVHPLSSPIAIHDLWVPVRGRRLPFFSKKSSRPSRWVSLCSVLPPPPAGRLRC